MDFDIQANFAYRSRRSVVISPRAAVASSQPLATQAGVSILQAGGTAADAAVAVAAALQVTQPCSTGLGGDAFCLYYSAEERRVSAYNGSGRSPAALDLATARAAADGDALPDFHAHTVTVPGAADTWLAVQKRFGTLALGTALAPAVALARGGFSVEPMTAVWWERGAERQLAGRRFGSELMTSGRGPRVGERFTNPSLANVLESLVSDGADGFYRGWIAERIVSEVAHEGGVMTHSDLASHAGEWVDPISALYGGYRIWECPPNGQGLAALLALQCYDRIKARASGPVARAHAQIEAMRQAFADAARHVADPAVAPAPLAELLSDEYAERRASDIDLSRRLDSIGAGLSPGRAGDDTVYFSVVDEAGNGCSFINSNYMGFGTGIVPEGCGFSLQNRGRGFVLEEGHPNVLSGGKRPYHTIIPALITTESDELAAVFGVMGGMMQPQGHLQVASHLIDNQMDPQSALDAARWQIADGAPNGKILIENDADPELIAGLRGLGHPVEMVAGVQRGAFGLGQIIAVGTDRMLWSGSDPRGDGHAAGF